MLLKICNKCGMVQEPSNFCPNCGNDLRNINCLPDESNSAGAFEFCAADVCYLEKDYAEALKWYNISAKRGNKCAKKRLKLFFDVEIN